MATDLEKKFFETFGVEQQEHKECTLMECRYTYYDCNNCQFHNVYKIDYPQITDRILLELICIDFEENPYKCRGGVDITNVKEYILNEFIREYEDDLYHDKQDIKHQVLTLFKEGVR